MTDRAKGFTVTLEKDIRVDEMNFILNALKMVKGVVDVQAIISDHNDFMVENRFKSEFKYKMYEFINKEL